MGKVSCAHCHLADSDGLIVAHESKILVPRLSSDPRRGASGAQTGQETKHRAALTSQPHRLSDSGTVEMFIALSRRVVVQRESTA